MGLPVVQEVSQAQPAAGMPHDEEKLAVARNLALVKRKVGIHSGKGGVGKTFVAVNLAFSLAAAGKKVGIIDADIDCPNVARFLNLREVALQGTSEGRIMPLEYRGLKIVSTHFLTDTPLLPMIVRGPIKHKVLGELLGKVEWGELDILLFDLPPGTSDVPMSSMLIGNMDGVIVVTTPQKEAVMDARKSALMAKDLNVPVLGIVENMSGDVFGSRAGDELAKEIDVPFLGTIPLAKDIWVMNEAGKAALVENPSYHDIARRIVSGAMGESVNVKKRSFWSKILGDFSGR